MGTFYKALIVFTLLGCSGGGDDGDPLCDEVPTQTDFDWINENVFTESCVSSQCHGGAAPKESLDLRSNAAFDELVGVPSVQSGGLMLVEPGNAENSYLYIKLGRGDQTLRDERLMPSSSSPLCDEKLDYIKQWIDDGAPQ